MDTSSHWDEVWRARQACAAVNKMHGTETCGHFFRCHALRHVRSIDTRRVFTTVRGERIIWAMSKAAQCAYKGALDSSSFVSGAVPTEGLHRGRSSGGRVCAAWGRV
jgi:hypothetical protein